MTTCATTQHKSRAVLILSIFMDLIEDLEDCMSLLVFQINSISSFFKNLYKYLIKHMRKGTARLQNAYCSRVKTVEFD